MTMPHGGVQPAEPTMPRIRLVPCWCASQMRPFGTDGKIHSHEDLPDLIGNIGALPMSARRNVKRSLRILREARTDADYRPGRTIMKAEAVKSVKEAVRVLHKLGALDD